MSPSLTQELLDYLGEYVTENKKRVMSEVLDHRTNRVEVVLEDIFHSQNASAVIRTMDCFGFQQLHITENMFEWGINPHVARGSNKWVNIHRYDRSAEAIKECIHSLKSRGFRIYATSPNSSGTALENLNLHDNSAFLFGTELTGLSDTALEMADEQIYIPMLGFTESFNISVSSALVLSTVRQKLLNSDIDWKLSKAERLEQELEWYTQIVKNSDIMIKEYLKSKGSSQLYEKNY